jgi:hypothetical protein
MEHRLMTEREKADTFMKSHELELAGKTEEAIAVRRSIPLQPYLAKLFKEKVGAEFLIESGWNLAEAEAEFGKDWLTAR